MKKITSTLISLATLTSIVVLACTPLLAFAQNTNTNNVILGFQPYIETALKSCNIPALSTEQETCLTKNYQTPPSACSAVTDIASAETCFNAVTSDCSISITTTQKACLVTLATVYNFTGNRDIQMQDVSQFGSPTSEGFVPLTGLPQLAEVTDANGLANFLNQVYVICIGIAASLAVLQLIRAGFMYSLEGASMSEKGQAKKIIQYSIYGLLLVLSPYIVFSLIDPRILNLDVGKNIQKLELAGSLQNDDGILGGGTPRVYTEEEKTKAIDLIASLTQACGFPMSQEQKTCFVSGTNTNSNDQLKECMGLNDEQLACVTKKARDYTDEQNLYGGSKTDVIHTGTYLGWGTFVSDADGSADNKADAYISACTKPKRGKLFCAVNQAGNCLKQVAYCNDEVFPVTLVQEGKSGGIIEINYDYYGKTPDQQRIFDTYKKECVEEVAGLNGVDSFSVLFYSPFHWDKKESIPKSECDIGAKQNDKYECGKYKLWCELRKL